MGRILFWMGLAVIIWAVIVLGRRRREAAERAMRQRAREEAKAVLGNGEAYCSEKCRGAARRAQFEDILHRDK